MKALFKTFSYFALSFIAIGFMIYGVKYAEDYSKILTLKLISNSDYGIHLFALAVTLIHSVFITVGLHLLSAEIKQKMHWIVVLIMTYIVFSYTLLESLRGYSNLILFENLDLIGQSTILFLNATVVFAISFTIMITGKTIFKLILIKDETKDNPLELNT